MPPGFSWIDRPHLAALARPDGPDDYRWLREQGIQLLIVLTEFPPHRPWLDDAGLLALHVPVPDFHAPTPEQMDQCVGAIHRAREQGLGVGVHCMAGLGRTGTILAAYFVSAGMSASEAIARVRTLRPGSIETEEQSEAVQAYAERLGTET
jgi:atypical dual specificity phosphatase